MPVLPAVNMWIKYTIIYYIFYNIYAVYKTKHESVGEFPEFWLQRKVEGLGVLRAGFLCCCRFSTEAGCSSGGQYPQVLLDGMFRPWVISHLLRVLCLQGHILQFWFWMVQNLWTGSDFTLFLFVLCFLFFEVCKKKNPQTWKPQTHSRVEFLLHVLIGNYLSILCIFRTFCT